MVVLSASYMDGTNGMIQFLVDEMTVVQKWKYCEYGTVQGQLTKETNTKKFIDKAIYKIFLKLEINVTVVTK